MASAFDVEVLFIAQKLGRRALEVPVRWDNVEGTKVSLLVGPRKAFVDPFQGAAQFHQRPLPLKLLLAAQLVDCPERVFPHSFGFFLVAYGCDRSA